MQTLLVYKQSSNAWKSNQNEPFNSPEDHIEASLSLKDQKEPFNSSRRQSCPSLDQDR